MIRAILFLVVSVFVLSVLRSVIGIVLRGFGDLFQSPQSQGGAPPRPAAAPSTGETRSGGELKRDPVCGTFIAASSAIQKKTGGEVYFFCSPECRDKFKA